ncbi:NDR1/HIN1-like protein 10 [Papaver somniferum]|uniref:NDR1/HIN1-like protein 10 n=1 Tax=Papaver somniferum TaxID=3469 RepID=UPI000E6FCD5C|nr:NDR1/HIN1-like protein 10 [Papaver somniferum]
MGNGRFGVYCGCSCLLIIIGGVSCLIVFLNILPFKAIKFHIIDASLTEFYVTNDDVLHYNLALNISVRNSNKMDRMSYHGIRSNPSCYGRDLASISWPSFRQGTKNTTLLYPVFQGQTLFKLQGSHLRDFNNDQRDGICKMNVNLYLTVQVKHAGGDKGVKLPLTVNCGLMSLHLSGSSSSSNNQTRIGGLFKLTRCKANGPSA